METFMLQLSTSLSSICCSSLGSCRHTVFDYRNRMIGLQEVLTQIRTATQQLENFLLGMNKPERTPTIWCAKPAGQPGLSHLNDLLKVTVFKIIETTETYPKPSSRGLWISISVSLVVTIQNKDLLYHSTMYIKILAGFMCVDLWSRGCYCTVFI